uniref:BPTI/Kunitz inhibitor domain-containing protein n=1 Tax=Trichuris muris TaxID=70415 RepID=A0A5S6QIE4_TRIMR
MGTYTMRLSSAILIASVLSIIPSLGHILSKAKIGEPCTPEDNWWYSYAGDATKFIYCKASEWKYVLETCEEISGIQKIFNETHQVCLFPDDIPLASLKAGAKNRLVPVGHNCDVDADCADGMHCDDKHCTCLHHHIQFNSMCYEESKLCPTSNWVRGQATQPITCSLNTDCPPGTFCRKENQTDAPTVCCHKREKEVCWPWAPYLVDHKPVKCDQHVNTCAKGFTCELDNETGSSYCCMRRARFTVETIAVEASTTKANRTNKIRIFHVCPVSHSPYLLDGYPLTCKPDSSKHCPIGYSCQLHENTGVYFCCMLEAVPAGTDTMHLGPVFIKGPPSIVIDGCPPQTTSVVGRSGKVVTCDVFQTHSCESGSTCLYSAHYKRYQCCRPIRSSSNSSEERAEALAPFEINPCPFGEKSFRSLLTNRSLQCYAAKGGISGCPDGFLCLQSPVRRKESYCCTSYRVCPNGKQPYVLPNTDVVPPCADNGSSNRCPYGHVCVESEWASFCCPRPKKKKTRLEEIGSLCVVGDPLVDPLSNNQFRKCSSSNPCPTTFRCIPTKVGSLCCPKQEIVCSQKINPGIRCGAAVTFRYAFDVRLGSCQPFSYQGCSGNANNFLSIAQCEEFCLQGLCFKGSPVQKRGRIVRCDLFERTCPLEHYCVAPVYGPPTSRICCPTASTICALSKAEGAFCSSNQTSGSISSFYFDFHSRSCVEFQFRVPHLNNYGKQYSPGNAGQHVSMPVCKVAGHQLAPGSISRSITMNIFAVVFRLRMEYHLRKVQFVQLALRHLTILKLMSLCGVLGNMIVLLDMFAITAFTWDKAFVALRRNPSQVTIEALTRQPLSCRFETDQCPQDYHCQLSLVTGVGICCPIALSSLRDVSRANPEDLPTTKKQMPRRYSSEEYHAISVPSYYSPEEQSNSSKHIDPQLQLFCNAAHKRMYGQSCCSDEQCLYKCQRYKRMRICGCPRHLILDLSTESPHCVTKCNHKRERAFCVRPHQKPLPFA